MKVTSIEEYNAKSVDYQKTMDKVHAITQELPTLARRAALWQEVQSNPALTTEEHAFAESVEREYRLACNCLMQHLITLAKCCPDCTELDLQSVKETPKP